MKCPECTNGRYLDPSHGCSRSCSTCKGTGELTKICPVCDGTKLRDGQHGSKRDCYNCERIGYIS